MSSNSSLDFSEFILRMSNPSERQIYEFDDFRLDAGHLMLYRRGDELELAPKAVEMLLALVERRGEIVSKDELLEAVWPDATVEESNLFLYLSLLRKTLGTQKNGKPWVQTLRRRGYRFNGDVRLAPAEDDGNATGIVQPLRDLHAAPAIPLYTPRGETPPRGDTDRPWLAGRSVYAAAGLIAVLLAVAFSYRYFFPKRPINSIAVMPFVNDNSELEYLSDGMTIELIGSLLKIPDLEVKASSTMFRYKGTKLDAATIGKELNVQAVLSPRMVQRGEDLTLYLELVDAQTENSLWQRTYYQKTSQLGVLQRDVIGDLARELRIGVTNATKQTLARSYTGSAEAYRLYLKGLFHIRKITESEGREGLVYLRQAVQQDPSYALAYAAIASAHRSLTLCCDAGPSELAEAKAAAERAVALDENLAEAQSALASSLYQYDWNFAEAEKHYLRALELDPKSAMSHFLYADFLEKMSRQEEALAEKARATQLEPFSPYFNAGAFNIDGPDKALERVRFTIDLDPNFWFSHSRAASFYAGRKMYPEAIAENRKGKDLAPEQTWSDVWFSNTLVQMGKIDQARAVLDELLRRSKTRYVPPYHIALVYNFLGDTEQALVWLEKAYQIRDPKMTFLNLSWKNLEEDPRFQDIKRRCGF